MSVLNAIFYVHQSWNIVLQKTIENCFRLVGFHSSPQSEELLEDGDADIPLTELAKLLNCDYAIPDENLHAKIYEDLTTNSKALVQDIVSNVLNLYAEEAMMRMTVNVKINQYQRQMFLKPYITPSVFFTISKAAG